MLAQLRKHIEEITPLSDEAFALVSACFSPRLLKRNQFLVFAGEPVSDDFFVVKGLLKAYQQDAQGKEHILQFAMENWWISDFKAFYQHSPATINIICLEDTELLRISYEQSEKLCAQLHAMEHFFRRKTAQGFVALQQRVLSLLTMSAQERYENFRTQYPRFYERLPKKDIAAYLGVSRETLSRFDSLR